MCGLPPSEATSGRSRALSSLVPATPCCHDGLVKKALAPPPLTLLSFASAEFPFCWFHEDSVEYPLEMPLPSKDGESTSVPPTEVINGLAPSSFTLGVPVKHMSTP